MSFLKRKLSKVEFGKKVLPNVTVIPKWGMIQLCVCVCKSVFIKRDVCLKKLGNVVSQ